MSTEFSNSDLESTQESISKTKAKKQARQHAEQVRKTGAGQGAFSHADSPEGMGAEHLSDTLSHDEEASLGEPNGSSSSRALSVCVYEDSHSLGQKIVKKMHASGHAVDYFSDADETLSSLAAKKYDLIIIGQSNDDGEEASVKLIKTTGSIYSDQKWEFLIMVLTLDTSPENVKALTTVGANLVMAKRVNGKLNNNIFEVAHIISTMPGEKSKVASGFHPEPDSIPVLIPDTLPLTSRPLISH